MWLLLCSVLIICFLCGVESRPRDQGENATNVSCIDVFSQFSEGKVTFTDGARKVLLNKQSKALGYKCLVTEDRYLTEKGKKQNRHRQGKQFNCSEGDMDFLTKLCPELTAQNKSRDANAPLKRSLVFPGTLWCGDGNKANGDKTKLGKFADTDSCCRAHDFCNPQIPAYTDDHKTGLSNDFPFTRLHCKCERDFKDCLKKSKDDIADGVGNIYFNVLPHVCFKEVTRCSNNSISPGCTSWAWDSEGNY